MDNFRNLTPAALRAYMAAQKEKDYLIVDVRQPEEYAQGHIPGANLFPLPTLESKLFDLPSDRDLVFYCRSGGRSTYAVTLAMDGEVTQNRIYNLAGGMLAWDGKALPDFPKIQVFDGARSLEDLLMTAMDLEKGAWRFYTHILENNSHAPFAVHFEQLSRAETAHARSVYAIWKADEKNPKDFETLFDELQGEILEGGEPLTTAVQKVAAIESAPCLNLMELSMNIEYMAFDLYRTMAEKADAPRARDTFLSISQAEKGHMRVLAKAIEQC